MRTEIPPHEHLAFDALCADVEEFEPLPAVKAAPPELDREDQDTAPLDGLILAGLVSP
jgi:hypothetical protein